MARHTMAFTPHVHNCTSSNDLHPRSTNHAFNKVPNLSVIQKRHVRFYKMGVVEVSGQMKTFLSFDIQAQCEYIVFSQTVQFLSLLNTSGPLCRFPSGTDVLEIHQYWLVQKQKKKKKKTEDHGSSQMVHSVDVKGKGKFPCLLMTRHA